VLKEERPGPVGSQKFWVLYPGPELGGLTYLHDLRNNKYGCEGEWVLVVKSRQG